MKTLVPYIFCDFHKMKIASSKMPTIVFWSIFVGIELLTHLSDLFNIGSYYILNYLFKA